MKRPPALPEVRTFTRGVPEIAVWPDVARYTTAVAVIGTDFGCDDPWAIGLPTRTITPDTSAEAGEFTTLFPDTVHPVKTTLKAAVVKRKRTRDMVFEIIFIDLSVPLPTPRLCPSASRDCPARAHFPRDRAAAAGSGTLSGHSPRD